MDEQLGYEGLWAYYEAALTSRSLRDVRVKIAFEIMVRWERYHELVPTAYTGHADQLVDDAEVALGMRRGDPQPYHAALAELLSAWRSVEPHNNAGTLLLSREVYLRHLDLRPMSVQEVRKLRAHTGLTPEKFGELFGVSRQRVYAWEQEGTRAAQPYLSALLRLYWPA